MTTDSTRKLISTNAAIWAASTLASVILPFVTDSMTDGRSAFLRVGAHAAPLLAGMFLSTITLSRIAHKPAE
jgi:hypothetical protein